jgi:hypothetical protein
VESESSWLGLAFVRSQIQRATTPSLLRSRVGGGTIS